jgi:hypothetical protein
MDIHDDTQPGRWTLWSWRRGAPAAAGSGLSAVDSVVGPDRPSTTGTLLAFPIRGEALLVRLADQLRSRIATCGPDQEALLLTMTRCPGSRLSIDRASYVEFRKDRSDYRVAIEAAPDTKITLETSDFDTLVEFVVQYLMDKHSTAATLGAAL